MFGKFHGPSSAYFINKQINSFVILLVVWLNSTRTKWFQTLLRCREINGLRNDFEKRPRDINKVLL